MLIITRRITEKLMINDNTVITILGIKGNQIRIGIQAPNDVTIHREEIYLKIQHKEQSTKLSLFEPC